MKGHLKQHLNQNHPDDDRQGDATQQVSQSVAAVAKKRQRQLKPVPVDFDNFNLLITKWLIGASLPPSMIEDEVLTNLFRFFNSSVKLWSRERIQSMTIDVFESMRENVRESIEHLNSKVSIALDFWTSCEQIFYMSVKAYWIDENWSLHNVLLDVSQIPYPCGGLEIFCALLKTLKVFNIEKRILSCTLDNSQPAIQVCIVLKRELDALQVPFCYIPCATQTLNLIIEDGLKTLRPMLTTVREFVCEMNASSEIAEDFRQMAVACQEGDLEFPLDTSPHWTGDYAMINFAQKAAKSMDIVIGKHEEALGGKKLLLNSTEKFEIDFWHSKFELFYKVIAELRTYKLRTIGLILLLTDYAFEKISAFRDDTYKLRTIGLILLLKDYAFEKISAFRDGCRKEWLKTVDDMAKIATNFNSIAYNSFTYMGAVLDPRIKNVLMPEILNIDKKLEEARGHFSKHYSTGQLPSTSVAAPMAIVAEVARKRQRLSSNTATTDELTQYLSEPPATIETDVLV